MTDAGVAAAASALKVAGAGAASVVPAADEEQKEIHKAAFAAPADEVKEGVDSEAMVVLLEDQTSADSPHLLATDPADHNEGHPGSRVNPSHHR